MSLLQLKIKKIHSDAVIPKYAHEGDAGFDLVSVENCLISPGNKIIVSTGLKMEIPKGFFGSIRDRSGLAAKKAIHVLAGVIDSHYRGEIKIVLINLGNENFEINKGDRIAQMIIQPCENCNIEEVQNIDETERGESGFGSTGIN